MSVQTVADFVIDLVEKEMDDETRVVTLDSRLREDLEVDSLSMAVIAVDTENRFGVRFDLADLARIDTVRDVVSLITTHPAFTSASAPAPDDAA
ncbi:acyl carrier protein [Microbacterium sp. SL62]|uniref:acyl carrier protein n=1 Tax=Microbacterium sp. SL62 TaxID=2995139 RepID=UPI0022734905|nr:acyl carrier protein [Microbacterium sp. SL62]MCY1716447.1 acyl carrier protein [Microbacterium sp. SL62]